MIKAASDCCCAVAKRKGNVPLEDVKDVTISSGCCLNCYGLKQLDVITEGNNFSDVRDPHIPISSKVQTSIRHVKDPEAFREKILEARKMKKEREKAGPVKTDPIGRLKVRKLANLQNSKK